MLRPDQNVPPGSFDYLLDPQRWTDAPPITKPRWPSRELQRKVVTTETPKAPPPTPPERGGGPRVRVEIEIVQRQPQARRPAGRWLPAILLWAIVLTILALATRAHAEQWRTHQDGFLTRSQSDRGDSATSYQQGFETLTTIDRADGSTQRCRSWKQGWQTFTQCD